MVACRFGGLFRRWRMAVTALTAIVASSAHAQNGVDLGTVKVTGPFPDLIPGAPFPAPLPGTPAYVAPSCAPPEASQPTSVVGGNFIRKSTIPAQNYDELVKFTSSLMNIQPAGHVSQQNYGESIRGLQCNQFNTTFDGIVLPGTTSNLPRKAQRTSPPMIWDR